MGVYGLRTVEIQQLVSIRKLKHSDVNMVNLAVKTSARN